MPPLEPRPRQTPRDILVHLHIFKNAGSTVDASLQASFGPSWQRLDAHQLGGCYSASEVYELLDEDRTIRAISSHQLRFPLPDTDSYRFHTIVFLRDPIVRCHSIYDYERMDGRRNSSDAPHTKQANALEFGEFVRWCLNDDATAGPISNFQTRLCSVTNNGLGHDDWSIPVTLANFLEATSNLTERALCGRVEDFAASAIGIVRQLKDLFPDLVLSGSVKNASISSGVATPRSHESIRAALGDETYEALCAANRFDSLLHRAFGRAG